MTEAQGGVRQFRPTSVSAPSTCPSAARFAELPSRGAVDIFSRYNASFPWPVLFLGAVILSLVYGLGIMKFRSHQRCGVSTGMAGATEDLEPREKCVEGGETSQESRSQEPSFLFPEPQEGRDFFSP